MANAIAHQVYVGIGSNVGNKKENFLEAVDRLTKLPDTKVIKESSLYESEPLGDSKDWYVNGAVEIETKFKPDMLLKKFKNIERAMGRKKDQKTLGRAHHRLGYSPLRLGGREEKKLTDSPSRNAEPQICSHSAQRNRPASDSSGTWRDHLRAADQRERRKKDSPLPRVAKSR